MGCDKQDSECQAVYHSSCACDGLFCSPHFYGRTNAIVIEEDVRQKYIFENHLDFYFKYMN